MKMNAPELKWIDRGDGNWEIGNEWGYVDHHGREYDSHCVTLGEGWSDTSTTAEDAKRKVEIGLWALMLEIAEKFGMDVVPRTKLEVE